MAKGNQQKTANGSALEFEVQLWATADKMRGRMDVSEYKHVVLGLIFFKYISDAFEEKCEQMLFGPPLVQRIFIKCHGSRTLAALRDALLPRLLSGELRVAEVKEVEHNPERQTV